MVEEKKGVMMKQKKTIFALVIVLVILVGAYAGLMVWNDQKAKQEEEQEEAAVIHITEDEDVSAFTYTDGSQTMSFVKEEDSWYYKEDKEIPMSQSVVENIADTIANLTAVRQLESPDDPEDYGLTEPDYQITCQTDDGEKVLLIGSMTGENYYASMDGSEEIYTIDSTLVSALSFDLSELVQTDTVPTISSGNLKKVEVTEGDTTTTYEEEDEMAELAGGFGTISLSDVVNYHAEGADLADYGLAESERVTVTATYKDADTEENETYTVYLGDVTEDGYQYVLPEGSKMVYQVDQDVITNMTTVGDGDEAED